MAVFGEARNVHVVGKSDYVYETGSSGLAAVLRGAAVLLRIGGNWDWFVNLGTRDYPLVTQDGIQGPWLFLLGLISVV